MKKQIILKIFVSIILLYVLFYYVVDIDKSIKVLSKIDTKIFIYCIFIYTAGQIISAIKWSKISNLLGFKINLLKYIQYYFKGMFFNTFLPTGIGGDIIKISYLCKDYQQKSGLERAAISVFIDRLSGVFVLISIAFLGTFITSANILTKECIYAGAIITLLIIAVIAFISINNIDFGKTFLKKIIYYNKLLLNKSLISIFGLSIIFHALVIIIHILLGHALNLDINITYFLILYPVTAIISSLPISLNGIGIKEISYIYLLNQISIEPSKTLVFVLCWNLIVLISSLLGAIFFIKKKSP